MGKHTNTIRLFLCGDVMTGRGIDQALPHPVSPTLYESWVQDARVYLNLAKQENGNIPVPLSWEYIWGDALKAWEQNLPALKLINLETSITHHPAPWPGKGINYRMHPKNINVLAVAGIDHCSLANNHVMDWGQEGLMQTLQSLRAAKIKCSGAGENEQQANKPSVFTTGTGRILVFSYASPGSGVPKQWQAGKGEPGVNLLNDFSDEEFQRIKLQIEENHQAGDIVIFSVHWGANWGYSIPDEHRRFSQMLIEKAGVDIIYGHSSHHPKGLEVYKDRLIIYGAGDFINDYEGIRGHEAYCGELTLMYFPELEFSTGKLSSLKMVPMKIKRFKLNFPSEKDARWLQKRLNAESEKLGAGVRLDADNSLWLEW